MKTVGEVGLYIHIPFCHARCGYCDFVTFTGKDDQRSTYTAALCKEIALYAPSSAQRNVNLDPPKSDLITVFFGGGTPSVLDPEHLQTIFEALHRHLSIAPDAEISLEANPESITVERAAAWASAGINRLSIGLQAYDDDQLKAIGRLHTVQQFESAYARVRAAGFANVNIDLMYGFAGQTLDDWKKTLAATVALEPEHLSAYALTVEEHTPFGAQKLEVDSDLQADMYAWARSYLPAHGLDQYEISNFARPGKECRHNLVYWRAQDYWGLGVGAVGRVGAIRWQNAKNLPAYYQSLEAGQRPRQSEETLDGPTQEFERLMLGLRLREGFEWGLDTNAERVFERTRLTARGWLEETRPGVWRIPDAYVPLTNQVLLPFTPNL